MDVQNYTDALKWLADAPMFIDSDQVARFHDAVIAPEYRIEQQTVKQENETEKKNTGEVKVEGKVGIPLVSALTAGVGTKTVRETSSKNGQNFGFVYVPIYSPQRQLIQLTEHYQQSCANRILYVRSPGELDWREPAKIREVPRLLVFLDLSGTDDGITGDLKLKLVPTAAEFENGKILPLFMQMLADNGERPPKYPESATNADALKEERKKYWAWFDKNFNATKAMTIVESAASENGRIRWIDYRVPISADGDSLHLHITPGGAYDTGVFAYNFIKRGWKHGLRLVGTLKSEPDMNVLAIYEK